MKKRLSFLPFLILFFISIGASIHADAFVKDEINEAFKKGNAKHLSSYFNDMVDMSLDNMGATYSRYQAESILADFFDKNPPTSFDVNQESVTSESSRFVIATYTSAHGCSYRVYYVLKSIKQPEKTERICVLNIAKNTKCQLKK